MLLKMHKTGILTLYNLEGMVSVFEDWFWLSSDFEC